jgi:hypothetical protein
VVYTQQFVEVKGESGSNEPIGCLFRIGVQIFLDITYMVVDTGIGRRE